MIGFVVPCTYENRLNIIKICKFFSNKKNIIICLIANDKVNHFLIEKKVFSNNIHLVNSSSKNVSFKRNLGINFFFKVKKIKWLSFLDSDCFIDNENYLKIMRHLIKNYKTDINLINLNSYSNKQIGNKLINLKIFNYLNIYKAGTPSIIIKKQSIYNLFDTRFGIGTDNFSAEDTKFLIDNFSKNVKIIKNAFIFHPDQIINIKKISNYSFGQRKLIRYLKFPHSLIFFIIIIHRPFIGLFYSLIKFDMSLLKIYLRRIKILIND